ncbi:peptidoglycan DD-metalloendopeptidase family protein [Arthrobacter sp. PsM3]|uniref:peptidoglycan DD-metalloendopeptidase family protein n=1 Tax=Arthrobacter sp. PsM3 TaxID=3030531 RepID=UPI00263A942E|nr:peptidoglycan DD-metalloendopeptidase family protein [Arthrobacter sp. PsM3]MDN4644913.1 peptidoglycan DD-metalloendopeptidase family protein [Arthrobacter sp. PsM3]
MRPVSAEFEINQPFGSMKTAGVAPSWTPDTVGWYVRLYGNYQPDGHAGADFKCPEGTPVHAMADGVVLWADWGTKLPGDDSNAGYRKRWYLYKGFPGIVTVIQHQSWIGVYAHLSKAPLNIGDRVTEGQVIALSGGTGGVDPHLHVEALVDNTYSTGGGLIYGRTNPEPFFGNGMAAAGTITPQSTTPTAEEDDMFTDQDRADLARTKQLLLSFQAAITDPVTGYVGQAALAVLRGGAAAQYVKGDAEDTIYSREANGLLRGIPKDEWDVAAAAGATFVQMAQSEIDEAKQVGQ